MDMEHRGDRHIDVVGAETADGFIGAGADHEGLGVEDELPVGEGDALGKAGRPRRVEGGGPRVLVEIREVVGVGEPPGEAPRTPRRSGFSGFGLLAAVGDQDDLFHGRELVVNGLQEGQEILMDEDDLILRMVHRVEDLLRRETPVLGVENRPHHGDGEETLQIAMAVVIEDADRIALRDAQLRKAVGQTVDPFVDLSVGQTDLVPVDDLLVRRKKERCGRAGA